ncbi:hypothetical protein LHJ74_24845 [Streptomyces sp. N2-109]|uniref:Flp pilus assembly protein RcpC/CpaB domain-containing protein n=1 Tax=Streptomyces gossypii TaxID=2883101 RepID=A0ABT2JYW4_9ACTN|nr:hypothetical protein [Streptomyces gossypii]MCT2593099.1 hypothetical protein [Streptomyces gossypii]
MSHDPGPIPRRSGSGAGFAPPRCGVPEFGSPIRAGGAAGRHRLRRAMRRRRRTVAAGLAVTAAAIAAVPHGRDGPPRPAGATASDAGPGGTADAEAIAAPVTVAAPVRIADAATVRLLRPGDRVDVIASTGDSESARVMARRARVEEVPEPEPVDGEDEAFRAGGADGALVVLTVPRGTATQLAGAGADTRLAVTLC